MLDIDEAKVGRNPFGLWLGWTLATVAGMLLGLVPPLAVVELMSLGLARVLVPLWTGFLVGLLQWLVLRRYLTHSVDWVASGGAGWAIGYAVGLLLIRTLDGSPLGTAAGYLLFGAIVAALQWPILRREIPNPLPWVLGSVAGWALGAFLGPPAVNLLLGGQLAADGGRAAAGGVAQVWTTAVIAGVTGLAAGGITAGVLLWIVPRPDRGKGPDREGV